MSILSSVQAQRSLAPPRILIHGPEKIGKSTFFAGGRYDGQDHPGAPNAVFIQTEDGLSGTHAQAFPLAQSYGDVMGQLQALYVEKHSFRCVIVDSIDWLEKLVHKEVIINAPEYRSNKNLTMEKAEGGYGKGFGVAMRYWMEFLSAINALRLKGMLVGLICHSQVVPFNDPMAEPYDRYELKLHQPKRGTGVRDVIMEWCDIIGFANKEIFVSQVKTADGQKVARATENPVARQVLHLAAQPSFVAGNRYGMAGPIELNWTAFMEEYTLRMK